MSKAEKFIENYTRNCSNELVAIESAVGTKILSYNEWLTLDDTREAVEIAREELIEKVCEYLEPKIWAMNMGDQKFTDEFIEKLKQAMKDE